MPLKKESQELNEMEEKEQYEKKDFITGEKLGLQTENSQKLEQETDSQSYFTCHQCGSVFGFLQEALKSTYEFTMERILSHVTSVERVTLEAKP